MRVKETNLASRVLAFTILTPLSGECVLVLLWSCQLPSRNLYHIRYTSQGFSFDFVSRMLQAVWRGSGVLKARPLEW